METLNSLVDKIYLINLDRRQDRLKAVSARLDKLNIKYERFSAFDGSSDAIKDEFKNLQRRGTHITSVGTYGCLLSHLAVLKDAKRLGLKRVLILEDDVLFIKNFTEELQKIKNIPDDWDVLYIGASQEATVFRKSNVKNGYYRANRTYGMFAYIVKNHVFDLLIDTFEKRTRNIDYSMVALQGKLKCYVMWENLIIADLNDSDTLKGTSTVVMTPQNFKLYNSLLGWDLSKYER